MLSMIQSGGWLAPLRYASCAPGYSSYRPSGAEDLQGVGEPLHKPLHNYLKQKARVIAGLVT